MDEPSRFLEAIKGFGGYTTTASVWIIVLGMWWKGLPALINASTAVLEAWTKRQSAVEERMSALLNDATARFERELKAADERHTDCMAANALLAKRVGEQDNRIAAQARTIAEQGDMMLCAQQTIDGLKRQIVSMQEAALRVAARAQPTSGILEPMLEQLASVRREGEA